MIEITDIKIERVTMTALRGYVRCLASRSRIEKTENVRSSESMFNSPERGVDRRGSLTQRKEEWNYRMPSYRMMLRIDTLLQGIK